MSAPCHAPKASWSPGMAWLQFDRKGLMFWALQAPAVSGQPVMIPDLLPLLFFLLRHRLVSQKAPVQVTA